MRLREAAAGLLIVGWFYATTGDYEQIHVRGPFLSKELCDAHLRQYVPTRWETTGCRLKAINIGEEKDLSPITGKDPEA